MREKVLARALTDYIAEKEPGRQELPLGRKIFVADTHKRFKYPKRYCYYNTTTIPKSIVQPLKLSRRIPSTKKWKIGKWIEKLMPENSSLNSLNSLIRMGVLKCSACGKNVEWINSEVVPAKISDLIALCVKQNKMPKDVREGHQRIVGYLIDAGR